MTERCIAIRRITPWTATTALKCGPDEAANTGNASGGKQFQEKVYAAVMALPEKQAKRIYARYYLGMTVNEIAEVEGVDPSRVRDSIRRGLKQLAKYF